MKKLSLSQLGKHLTILSLLTSSFTLMAPTFAGNLLVANKSSDSVTFFDETNLEKKQEVKVGHHPHEIAVSPNAEIAIVSNYGSFFHPGSTLSVIDTKTASVVKTIILTKDSRPHGVKFISDTQIMVTAEGVQSLLLVDVIQGKILKTLTLPGKGAHLITVDKALQYAYVTNTDGRVFKVELKSFRVIANDSIGKAAEGLTLSQEEDILLVTNRKENLIVVLRTKDLAVLKKIRTDSGPIRIALYNHGKSAVVTNTIKGSAQTLDLTTLTITNGFKTTHTYSPSTGKIGGLLLSVPINIAIRADEHTAYIANSFAGNITLVDLEKGEVLKTFAASVEPDGLALV